MPIDREMLEGGSLNQTTSTPTPTPTPSSVNTTSLAGILAASQFGSSTPWAQAAASNTTNTINPNAVSYKKATDEQKALASALVVATGGKSTDPKNRFKGETATQANARITAAFKNLLAKPILTAEQEAAGFKVRFVRTGAGGQGEYTVITPAGYTGPKVVTRQWSKGIIPATGKYTTGTTLGVYSNGDGTYTKVGTNTPITIKPTATAVTSTGATSTTTKSTPTSVMKVDPKNYSSTKVAEKLSSIDMSQNYNDIIFDALKVIKGTSGATADDIIKWAADFVKSPDNSKFFTGGTFDDKGNRLSSYNTATNLSGVLSQIAASAAPWVSGERFVGGGMMTDFQKKLNTSWGLAEAVRKGLEGDPSTWAYKPGETFTRDGMTYFVNQPGKTQFTPEELKNFLGTNESRVQLVDPISGAVMSIDPQDGRIFYMNEGPYTTTRWNGQLIGEGYEIPGKSWSIYDNPTSKKSETFRTSNSDGTTTVFFTDGSNAVLDSSGNVIMGTMPSTDTSSTSTTNTSETGNPTTNVEVLKSILRGNGFNSRLIESSASYLQQLLKDGLDYENAVEVFLSSKDYTLANGTKVTSPFYTEYGYLNESAPKPLSASELYGFVEGTKDIVKRYALNAKFATPESMKKYIQNQVTVEDIEVRANLARLKSLEADPYYVDSLKKLGYIKDSTGLTDFFLNNEIGQDTLEQNKRTATFATEALRRANEGVQLNPELASKMAAGLTAKGYSDAQISSFAAQGYANISGELKPLTALSGIYEGTGALNQSQIQSELESEEFLGMASARRKKLIQQNVYGFQGTGGLSRFALGSGNTAGML